MPKQTPLYEKHLESNAKMVLAFDILVESPPTGNVKIGLGRGSEGRAEVDLTKVLAGLAVHEWHSLLVPLRRFAVDEALDV